MSDYDSILSSRSASPALSDTTSLSSVSTESSKKESHHDDHTVATEVGTHRLLAWADRTSYPKAVPKVQPWKLMGIGLERISTSAKASPPDSTLDTKVIVRVSGRYDYGTKGLGGH
jgi:hypothetical protein